MPEEKNTRRPHNVLIYGRERAEISGVENVVSFDETMIVAETTHGVLSVEGEGLTISKLDTDNGEIFLEGTVNSVFYPVDEKTETKSIFKRIFS